MMTLSIIELCLTTFNGQTPFAVLVEQGESCAWQIAGDIDCEADVDWARYVLAHKERRPDESWVLDAWKKWLEDLSQTPQEHRRQVLMDLDSSTPGIMVRRPRKAHTHLSAGSVASMWKRNRLFIRAENVAAEIAAKLAKGGKAHWNSTITIDGHQLANGDWIVEGQSMVRSFDTAEFYGDRERSQFRDDFTEPSLAIINIIEDKKAEELMNLWNVAHKELGKKYPYGIAVIRNSRNAESFESGCLIGDKFPAAVSLAVAAVRARWGASPL